MTTKQAILAMIDDGTITGSRAALERVRRSNVCWHTGRNGHGDKVYRLGRLPRERAEKTLYLHEFVKPNATGARYRAYVQYTP